MSEEARIKRIPIPVFLDTEMIAKNPIPLAGEIVYTKDPTIGLIDNFKVGDGFSKWTELPFRDISQYEKTSLATVTIGDIVVGSSNFGRKLSDIIEDIISPYQAPEVSNVKNQANGVDYKNVSQLEIGQSISTAIAITFDVSNQNNLVETPIEIDSSGFFLESNPYPNASILLSPNGTLAPTSPKVYTIKVRAIHTNGNSDYVNTQVRFDTRFIWGSSALSDLTTTQHALDLIASGGGQGVRQGYSGEIFEISATGYGFVLIPSVLIAPGTIVVWSEVSDPNATSSIGMVNMGTLSVNNGVGTYGYEKFRTPFSNTGSVKLKSI